MFTLALGIGANAAVFSLINGLLLRPLPVPHAEQLAILRLQPGAYGYTFSTPIFRILERHNDLFQNVFAFTEHTFQVRNGNKNEAFEGGLVSGQFFDGLSVQPELGRCLNAADDQPGGSPAGLAVVISDQFWKKWFNRAPDAIGRKLMLDNVPFVVVGVMPKSFIGADTVFRPQIYTALATEPLVDAPFNNTAGGYHTWWFQVAARRKAGMSLEQTNAALRAVSGPLMKEAIPEPGFRFNNASRDQLYLAAEPGSTGYSYLRIQFRYPLLVVSVLCGLVLLLACLNLASLLMARVAAREREIATRLAIGATRRRVIQQQLVESMLLAMAGTIIGFAVAPLVSHMLALLMTNSYIRQPLDTSMDMRVLLFAAGMAILCTLVVGLVPALQASSGSLQDHARQGNHNLHTAHRQHLIGRILLAGEVAISLIVVAGAGLLGTSLVRIYRTGLGFDAHGVVLSELSVDKLSVKGQALLQLYREFADQVAHTPGVASVSYANVIPLSGGMSSGNWSINGKTKELSLSGIAPDYFRTMRIPVLAGRDFAWSDTLSAPRRVILNEAAAKLFFPNTNAVGQQIFRGEGKDATAFEVIAVVGNTTYLDMRDPAPPMAYQTLTQDKLETPYYTAVLRMKGKPGAIADALHNIATRLAPEIPAPEIYTMDQRIKDAISSERMITMLAVFFGVCALMVTGIGLYGTLAYSTARRTSEIGIRMALGAQRGQVALLVFRENAMVAVIGTLIGLGVALLAARALTTLLYNTSSHDVPVMLLSVGALGVIACLASLLPALRASRIEPMEAIRCE